MTTNGIMITPKQLITGGDIIIRHDGIILQFNTPRRIISSGIIGGGLHHATALYNHRLTGHYAHERDFPGGSVPAYLRIMAEKKGLDVHHTSTMITTARMDWHSYACYHHDDIIIETITTAGVEQTASRAGDPAYYYEQDGNYYPVGTINIMISTNAQLPDGILVKALITATEGKTTALQDHGIASLASGLPATGTGTDGMMIATDPNGPLRTDAGAHSKLGELLAKSVHDTLSHTFTTYPPPWNQFAALKTPTPIDQETLKTTKKSAKKATLKPDFDHQ